MKKLTPFLVGLLLIISCFLNAQAPVANFSVSDTVVCAPGPVIFTDLSKNNPTNWQWFFPGGTPNTSSLQNPPPISYNSSGYHFVKLVVENRNGIDSIAKNNYIHVYYPPVLSFTGPMNLCQGAQGTIAVYSDAYYSYHWSTGATTSSINITGVVTETYTVRVANGPCFKDTSFTVHVDTCLGISSITNQLELSIYPNPANSFLHITIEKPIAEPTQLYISDIAGRTLISRETNHSQSQLDLDVSSLSSGIYFIKLQTDNGILVKKFVKE